MIDITIMIIQPAKYSSCLQLDDLDYEVLSFIALNWAKKKKEVTTISIPPKLLLI